ncbi:hypothetical protein T09_2645 [Trichinella sp. T9]|uniref:Uncharacterized protein n=1 Tax=Trichinella murrelli TaxID=144512 RepID=A0A0V0U1F6_9BILA|nr:hypothetical protein T05_11834 [Trichinella murrelli]KRX56931.1 hypothetical protein T09_2645 [Trichinella sp. T9]
MVNILVSASEIANNKDLARTYSMISSFMLELEAPRNKTDFVPIVMHPASLNQAVHQSSLNKLTIREDRTMLYHIHYY